MIRSARAGRRFFAALFAVAFVVSAACAGGDGSIEIVITSSANLRPTVAVSTPLPPLAAPTNLPLPTPTVELLIPTPAPDPEIYRESGVVFLDTWMGEVVKRPPAGVGPDVGEAPRLEDSTAMWRSYFSGTRVLANGVSYELCGDGVAIYVSGSPGRWPEGATFHYRLLPYPAESRWDYSHIELQVTPDAVELRYSRRRYEAYHFASVDGYTVGVGFDGTRRGVLIDAPVVASGACRTGKLGTR